MHDTILVAVETTYMFTDMQYMYCETSLIPADRHAFSIWCIMIIIELYHNGSKLIF